MSTAEIIAQLPRLTAEELAQVQAKLRELTEPAPRAIAQTPPAGIHPALGIWKDRTDLPDDSTEASNLLRKRMMRQNGSAGHTTKS